MTQTIFKNVIPYGANPISVVLPENATMIGVANEKGFVTVYASAPSVEPSETYLFDLLGVGDTFDDSISRQFLGVSSACCNSRLVFLRI